MPTSKTHVPDFSHWVANGRDQSVDHSSVAITTRGGVPRCHAPMHMSPDAPLRIRV